MTTSQRGVDLIRQFEGLSLRAVKLAGEAYYTIGYGHYGADVAPDQRITEAEAEALLRKDLAQFERWVAQYVPFQMNQNQFDALVSFTYNCGPGSLKQLVTGRTPAQVVAHMTAYTKSGSAAYTEGLRRRREQERALFLEEDEEMDVERFKELWREMRRELQDNDASGYSAEARRWAVENGIVQGGDGADFNGMWEDLMTREQLVTVLFRYAQRMGRA